MTGLGRFRRSRLGQAMSGVGVSTEAGRAKADIDVRMVAFGGIAAAGLSSLSVRPETL